VEAPRAARLAARALSRHDGEIGDLAVPTYTDEQVLGDWFPEASPPP